MRSHLYKKRGLLINTSVIVFILSKCSTNLRLAVVEVVHARCYCKVAILMIVADNRLAVVRIKAQRVGG